MGRRRRRGFHAQGQGADAEPGGRQQDRRARQPQHRACCGTSATRASCWSGAGWSMPATSRPRSSTTTSCWPSCAPAKSSNWRHRHRAARRSSARSRRSALSDDACVIRGWFVDTEGAVPGGIALQVNGQRYAAEKIERMRRPDVMRHFGLSSDDCGFRATIAMPRSLRGSPNWVPTCRSSAASLPSMPTRPCGSQARSRRCCRPLRKSFFRPPDPPAGR